MANPLNYRNTRMFPQDILDDLDRRLKALETAVIGDRMITYEDVVSICDAHGINLPVEYVEHAVEIANFAARAKDSK